MPDADQQEHEQRRDRDLVRAAVEACRAASATIVAVEDRADDGAELPDQAVQAEHLADALGRREAQEHEPIDDADAAQPGAEQRAGDEERDGREEQA